MQCGNRSYFNYENSKGLTSFEIKREMVNYQFEGIKKATRRQHYNAISMGTAIKRCYE